MHAMKIQCLGLVFLYTIKEGADAWYSLDGVESHCGSAIMKIHAQEVVYASLTIMDEVIYGYIENKDHKRIEYNFSVHDNELYTFAIARDIHH